jgi:hypothetical protein
VNPLHVGHVGELWRESRRDSNAVRLLSNALPCTIRPVTLCQRPRLYAMRTSPIFHLAIYYQTSNLALLLLAAEGVATVSKALRMIILVMTRTKGRRMVMKVANPSLNNSVIFAYASA